jgi:hypothetical protein
MEQHKYEYGARYRTFEHIDPIVVNKFLSAVPGTKHLIITSNKNVFKMILEPINFRYSILFYHMEFFGVVTGTSFH